MVSKREAVCHRGQSVPAFAVERGPIGDCGAAELAPAPTPVRIALLGGFLLVLAGASLAPVRAAKRDEPTVPEIMEKGRHGYGPDRDAAISKLRSLPKDKIKEFKVDRFLLGIIKDGGDSPRLRRRAVEVLIHLANSVDTSLKGKVLGALVSILKSDSEATMVRSRIAQEIWKLVDPSKSVGADKQAIQALEATVKGRAATILKIMAMDSLARIGAPRSGQVLREKMTNSDQSIKDAATAAYSKWMDRQGSDSMTPGEKAAFARIMAPRIGDSSYSHRQRILAMRMVARTGDRRGIPYIEDVIKTQKVSGPDDEELVTEALKALATYRDPKTVKTLSAAYKRYKKKENGSIRAAICAALGEFYQALAASKRRSSSEITLINKTLLSALRDDESTAVARAAAYALGNLSISKTFPRKDAIAELIDALIDKDDQVRSYCKESLEMLTDYSVITRPKEKHKEFQKRWSAWWKKNRGRFRK